MKRKNAIWKARLAALLLGGLVTGAVGVYYTFYTQNGDAAAGYTVLIGLYAMVVIDQIILLFDNHPEDVISKLELIEKGVIKQTTSPETIKALESFQGKKFHHYHLRCESDRDAGHKSSVFGVQASGYTVSMVIPVKRLSR